MKVYYLINNNNEIYQDGYDKFHNDCLEMEEENYHIKNGYNGALFFEDYMETEEYKEKEATFKQTQNIKRLRRQRESECFPVINRGAFWYELRTEEEKTELREWYQKWLDVTDTLVIPEKPTWL